MALIDGADEEDEQRFSIAHELAHFLRDYWNVRRQIRKRLARDAAEVLDGQRPPTSAERLQALLRNVSLGFDVHLMERDRDGYPMSACAAQAEEDADRLAFELLAPAEHVLANGTRAKTGALAEKLKQFYGLPALQAAQYAGILRPPVRTDPLIRRLRAVT
jgi:Zn-dependent peptidase ImmA (M78 family)